jgi:hypothetical protein
MACGLRRTVIILMRMTGPPGLLLPHVWLQEMSLCVTHLHVCLVQVVPEKCDIYCIHPNGRALRRYQAIPLRH